LEWRWAGDAACMGEGCIKVVGGVHEGKGPSEVTTLGKSPETK
jgi:hypothetical protein